MEKKIKVMGKIGNTEYQNNDRCKVLSIRGGVQNSLCWRFSRQYSDGGAAMQKKIIAHGFIENGTGKHQSNTLYSRTHSVPALTTIDGGGTQQIKVLKKWEKEK